MSKERPIGFHNLNGEDGIKRQLAEGMTTRIFSGENIMFSIVTMEPDAKGSIHEHPEEQWGVVLEGSGTRIQNGQHIPVSAGDFWQTEGGVSHGFIAGPDGAKVLDVFGPPRGDYKKEGKGFS